MTSGPSGSFRSAIPPILALILLGAPTPASIAVSAQDFSPGSISKAYPYKDLPGVPDQDKKKQVEEKAPDCTRELRMRGFDRIGRLDRFDRDAPVSIYSCEQNGLIIESEHAPIPKTWNPLDLR